MPKTIVDIETVVDQIVFLMFPSWELQVRLDSSSSRPYLQVFCDDGIDNDTGTPQRWTGRKWFLSPHMTNTEIVATAFKAYQSALEHEFRELFLYRGVRVFDPHADVDAIVEMGGLPGAFR